jgi:hypothetical protein
VEGFVCCVSFEFIFYMYGNSLCGSFWDGKNLEGRVMLTSSLGPIQITSNGSEHGDRRISTYPKIKSLEYPVPMFSLMSYIDLSIARMQI